eukprot:976104-Prymnesium_polylepis.3
MPAVLSKALPRVLLCRPLKRFRIGAVTATAVTGQWTPITAGVGVSSEARAEASPCGRGPAV